MTSPSSTRTCDLKQRLFNMSSHKHLLRTFTEHTDGCWLYSVCELCEHNLTDYVQTHATAVDSKRLAHELLLGLQHIHSHGIYHGRLKPANVLIDVTGTLKLTDYALPRSSQLQCGPGMPRPSGVCWLASEQLSRACLQCRSCMQACDVQVIGSRRVAYC